MGIGWAVYTQEAAWVYGGLFTLRSQLGYRVGCLHSGGSLNGVGCWYCRRELGRVGCWYCKRQLGEAITRERLYKQRKLATVNVASYA